MNDEYIKNRNRFARISNSANNKNLTQQDIDYRGNMMVLTNEWFKRFLDYNNYLTTHTLRYHLLQGEVYEVDFGRNIGCEINERHYAVILHDSTEMTQNVLVCPLSTKIQDSSESILVNIGKLDNVKTAYESYAKISQIRTIDKVRIYIRPIINQDNDQSIKNKFGPVTSLNEFQLNALLKGVKNYLRMI